MLSPETQVEVERYAVQLLQQAGVGERIPTPVGDVVEAAGLVVVKDFGLSVEQARELCAVHGELSLQGAQLLSALQKAIGLVDLRSQKVYVSPSLTREKTLFVKLHEVGHKVLPWQRDIYMYLDDHLTLDPETNAEFERQANLFAAEVLFQGVRFAKESLDCPLSMASVRQLARRYGASMHATARRFVEVRNEACALIVFDCLPGEWLGQLTAKKVIYSPTFLEQFGVLPLELLGSAPFPFEQLYLNNRRWVEGQYLTLPDRNGEIRLCCFDYFWNSYNALVLVSPAPFDIPSFTSLEGY